MIDLYVLSIFDKLKTKIKDIGFRQFCDIVKVSVMGLELLEVFRTPFEKSLGRNSSVFTGKVDRDAISRHQHTRNTLLNFID
jgi:hypothetical protein